MKRHCGRRLYRRAVGWFLAVGCVALCGCGAGDRRQAASGVATLDGRPIEQGAVVFEPTENNNAPTAGARVTDGEYSLPRKRGGVLPGKYLIKMTVLQETGRTVMNRVGQMVPEVLPVEIKESAGIPATVVDGGSNRFDLHVHSAK